MSRKGFIPWLFSVVVLFSSCENTYGIETSEGGETAITVSAGKPSLKPQDQSVMMDQLRDKRQIVDVTDYNGVCTISFNGGPSARILESCFPFIQTTDEKAWTINGKKTDIPVRKDEDGKLIVPELKPGAAGRWFLDSKETPVPSTSYQKFDADETAAHLSGLLAFQDRLYVYISDGTIAVHDVIKDSFYLVPDYWFDHLVEKERKAEAAIAEADGDCNAFVFFTDAHWGRNVKKSPALIRHITDYTPIKDVVFGGDVITTQFPTPEAALEEGKRFQSAFSFLGPHLLCLYGNHDGNAAGQPLKKELHLSQEQVMSYLQNQMTDVTYKEGYNFYVDYSSSKTRLIGLDTGIYNDAVFGDGLPNTARFAIESLSSLPEGWHIIIASHLWCSNKVQPDRSYKQVIDSYIKPILKIFDDYNARRAGVYTYKKTNILYNFSKELGKVEFCIGGHVHTGATLASEDGIPVFTVMSDYIPKVEKGTSREQSVTLVVADYKNRKLNLLVVGKGTDRSIDL